MNVILNQYVAWRRIPRFLKAITTKVKSSCKLGKLLDEKMLDLVEKGNLTTNRRYMAMIKINKHIGEASVFIPEHPREPHAVISSQRSDRVELPKLVLHPFSGDIAM